MFWERQALSSARTDTHRHTDTLLSPQLLTVVPWSICCTVRDEG